MRILVRIARPPSSPTRTRLGREDWEAAALAAIATGGLAAVAVEPLARTLGVTKGSFYAHFAGRDALIEATLARWERSHGPDGLASVAGIPDPAARLRYLVEAALMLSEHGDESPGVGMLGALHDPRVRETVRRVSEARMALIADAYRELGLTPAPARRRARLAYATLIGLVNLTREHGAGPVDGRTRKAFVDEALRVLLADLRD